MFKLSKRSKHRRKGVDPRLIEIDDLAIQITLIDFGHPEYAGVRSEEDQNELYRKGRSSCDGYVVISDHQTGKALDFYAFVDGKASWQEDHLAIVAAAYLQAANTLGYQIDWGGFWQRKTPKFVNGIPYGWDMPHIKLVD